MGVLTPDSSWQESLLSRKSSVPVPRLSCPQSIPGPFAGRAVLSKISQTPRRNNRTHPSVVPPWLLLQNLRPLPNCWPGYMGDAKLPRRRCRAPCPNCCRRKARRRPWRRPCSTSLFLSLPNNHPLGSTTIRSPAGRAEQIARESGYKLRRSSRLYLGQKPDCRPDLYQWSHVQRADATLEPFRPGRTYAGNPFPCAHLVDIARHIAGTPFVVPMFHQHARIWTAIP
jgi:hypothetical protein